MGPISGSRFTALVQTSVVDLDTLNLDPDTEFWYRYNLDPDPGLCYQF